MFFARTMQRGKSSFRHFQVARKNQKQPRIFTDLHGFSYAYDQDIFRPDLSVLICEIRGKKSSVFSVASVFKKISVP